MRFGAVIAVVIPMPWIEGKNKYLGQSRVSKPWLWDSAIRKSHGGLGQCWLIKGVNKGSTGGDGLPNIRYSLQIWDHVT